MNIVGLMRVKNEARWIKRSIKSILPLCCRIFVLDDHSTDETASICKSIPRVELIASPFTGLEEVRDKNYLLEQVGHPHRSQWVIMIDGDEELMPGDAAKLKLAIKAAEGVRVNALAFSVLYLWDLPDQVRVDGVYRSMSRVSAFRLGSERFEATIGAANFHCGNCPQAIRQRAHAGVSLLHYGYMHRADRLRKYEWYRANDPGNQMEDEYRHIVIGDVFPRDSRFRHGGPLECRRLPRVLDDDGDEIEMDYSREDALLRDEEDADDL